ncbi:MAG: hypothetical protein E7579_06730 [Ruminococcaceae bacterium]|nr:hypothetical protein [Oscillospiraceae bacterium]
MGFGLVIAGFVLLFNPVLNVIDLVPDALGFLLIVIGLTRMSFFIGKVEQARDLFSKLAMLEAAKCVMILTIPYASGSDIVLQTFVFGLGEALLFVPAVNYLFEGLSFAGLWYNASAMYEKKTFKRPMNALFNRMSPLISRITKKKIRKHPERVNVEWITYVREQLIFFYIFRICATLIPELTELQMYENIGDVTAFSRSLAYYKPFLYVVLSAIVLILGIRHIRTVSSFFKAVRNDKPFLHAMEEKYRNDILPRDTFFIARGMKQSMACFSASVFCCIVVTIDDMNVLVGAISAGFLIGAAVILKRYIPAAKWVIPFAAVRGVLGLVNMVLQYDYYVDYTEEAVKYVDKAYTQYYRLAAFECAEYVFAAIAVILYMFFLLKAIKAHLAVCGIQHENAMYSKRNRDIETYNTAGGKLLLSTVMAVINFILAGSYHYIMVNMTLIVVINTAVTVIWAVYTWHTVNVINDMLYNKEIQIF